MALRDLSEVPYLPILSLRPAEMRALEELPSQTKDRLLPIVHLRPWVGSHFLENALARMKDAYGDRPIVIAMGDVEIANNKPVHSELAHLRSQAGGFVNWCQFIRDNANFIPAIQYGALEAESVQIQYFHSLGRGLFVIVDRAAFVALPQIAQRIGQLAEAGQDVCFVLDFGHASSDHLQVALQVIAYIATVRHYAPYSYIAFSASSFPDSFVGRVSQQIYERRLFEQVILQPDISRIIFSDRGSACAERINGGGGQPAPRIDYPLPLDWNFYRSDLVGFPGYMQQADLLVRSAGVWNPNLRVWGTQMIERTAAGDTSAIGGAQKATAARINLHLQRQTYFHDEENIENTDEDWNG